MHSRFCWGSRLGQKVQIILQPACAGTTHKMGWVEPNPQPPVGRVPDSRPPYVFGILN